MVLSQLTLQTPEFVQANSLEICLKIGDILLVPKKEDPVYFSTFKFNLKSIFAIRRIKMTTLFKNSVLDNEFGTFEIFSDVLDVFCESRRVILGCKKPASFIICSSETFRCFLIATFAAVS